MTCVAGRATEARPILVIGGGAVGVCCAYWLRLAGVPVVLADAAEIGSGASSGNLGLVAASHSMPLASPGVVVQAVRWMFRPASPFAIELPPSASMLRWMWQFFRASRSPRLSSRAALLARLSHESLELFQDLSRSFQFHRECLGTLEVFRDLQSFRKFQTQVPAMRAAGIKIELLSDVSARKLAFFATAAICGGAYYPDDCTVDPLQFVRAVGSQLRSMGVEIREHAKIVRLRREGTSITAADLRDGTIAVAGVVLANGVDTNSLLEPLGIRVPLQAARGYTLDFSRELGWPKMPVMFAEAKLLTTSVDGRLRLGGYLRLTRSGHSRHRDVTPESLTQSLLGYVGEPIVNEIRRTASSVWSGNRPCSPDGLPFVGRTAQYANLYLATGHGMLGLTLAPVTGKQIARMLQDAATAAPSYLLAPSRFQA